MGGRGASSMAASGDATQGRRINAEASFSGSGSITKEQQEAIDLYVADDHGEVGKVRAVQQGNNLGEETEKYQVMGDVIEQMISENKAEYDTIYRGVRLSDKDLKKYKEGYEFDQMGTSSWSGSDGMALRYANRRDIEGVPVMFISHDGKNAAPIGHMSALNEDEWLHSKNQKFRTTADPYKVYIRDYATNVMIIEVEEI